MHLPPDKPLVLDIGGEGRHAAAWNLNPSPVRTGGPQRGEPIAKHLPGRADAIPLPDGSVDEVIVERTPLNAAALLEIRRVLAPNGQIVLRHAIPPGIDPHAAARAVLGLPDHTSLASIGNRPVQETRFGGPSAEV